MTYPRILKEDSHKIILQLFRFNVF